MKLKEIKIDEGLVDINTLGSLEKVASDGLTNDAFVLVLAKGLMAIQDGYVGMSVNFNSYFTGFFPPKVFLDTLKALSKEEAKQVASFVLKVFKTKDTQLASLVDITNLSNLTCYVDHAQD